jgi:hypothetical protein
MAGPALLPLLLGGAALGSLYDSYGDKIAKTAEEHKKWRKKQDAKKKSEKEKEKGDNMSDNWIQGAVKKPGALRATAKREGLIKGDEKLSGTDLKKLAAQAADTGNKKLAQRVNLAKTFAKMRKADGGEVEKDRDELWSEIRGMSPEGREYLKDALKRYKDGGSVSKSEAARVGKEVEESSPIWSRYSRDVPHASAQYADGGPVTPVSPVKAEPKDVLRTKKEGAALGREMEDDADVRGADSDYKAILAALKELDEESKPRYDIERS